MPEGEFPTLHLCVTCADPVGADAFRVCDSCYVATAIARTFFVPVVRPTMWQRLRRWWRA